MTLRSGVLTVEERFALQSGTREDEGRLFGRKNEVSLERAMEEGFEKARESAWYRRAVDGRRLRLDTQMNGSFDETIWQLALQSFAERQARQQNCLACSPSTPRYTSPPKPIPIVLVVSQKVLLGFSESINQLLSSNRTSSHLTQSVQYTLKPQSQPHRIGSNLPLLQQSLREPSNKTAKS
jgi:hypothetical protein